MNGNGENEDQKESRTGTGLGKSASGVPFHALAALFLCSHGNRNEMSLSGAMALDRSSLHPWFLRLERNISHIASQASDVTKMACAVASRHIARLL
jgi:hypothetical protein